LHTFDGRILNKDNICIFGYGQLVLVITDQMSSNV